MTTHLARLRGPTVKPLQRKECSVQTQADNTHPMIMLFLVIKFALPGENILSPVTPFTQLHLISLQGNKTRTQHINLLISSWISSHKTWNNLKYIKLKMHLGVMGNIRVIRHQMTSKDFFREFEGIIHTNARRTLGKFSIKKFPRTFPPNVFVLAGIFLLKPQIYKYFFPVPTSLRMLLLVNGCG